MTTWYFSACGHANVQSEPVCGICAGAPLTREDRAIIQHLAARRARLAYGMPSAVDREAFAGWHATQRAALAELRAVARPQAQQDDFDIMYTFEENNDPLDTLAAMERRAFVGL